MSTTTFVISYSHTVTYVTAKMLHLISNIIRDIGLDPANFTNNWAVYESGITTWLASRHLQCVTLEVYDPKTNKLVTRWDLDIVYSTVGDGDLWADAAAIRYAIAKAGLVPAACLYGLKLRFNDLPGKPEVAGWSDCTMRSTEGFNRYAVGATISGNGLATETAYWSR
jgi:hypothetical protein